MNLFQKLKALLSRRFSIQPRVDKKATKYYCIDEKTGSITQMTVLEEEKK